MPRRTKLLLGGVGALVLLLIGGVVWAGFQLADQLGAPGIPPATGSGPCTTADTVNIQLVYADGHTVQACTHDQPDCRAQATLTVNGQSQANPIKFDLDNQLRSSARRYILNIQTDAAIAANVSGQVFQLQGWAPPMPKGPQSFQPVESPAVGHAVVSVTPRDPVENGFVSSSGTLTLSAAGGIVRGVIDGAFPTEFRSDRPQPSGPPSPVTITGRFACRS